MILAVNVNAAIDWVYFIDRFVPNTHMRVKKAVLSIGGKGLDAALVLQTLGAPTLALSFIAGENGRVLADLLDQKKIPHELIWLPGETRVSNVIVETELKNHSHITTTGYPVNQENCECFLEKITQLAPNADWAVMGGSLPLGAPPDFYGQVIKVLQQFQVKTLIDCPGIPLLKALPAHPDIVKMNREEFQDTFCINVHEPDQWIPACQQVMDRFQIDTLVITCGKDGILAFTAGGIYQAKCTQALTEVNAAGAGDAVSAALAYQLSIGSTWPEALTLAAATGAAVVLTEGTAECRLQDIRDLMAQVQIVSCKKVASVDSF
jgi:1-phosphofructokinase family hexose kinase